MSSCSTIQNYVAPEESEPRAFANFEYDSRAPISTGQFIAFDGDFICGDHDTPNSRKLFQHGKANPLVTEINPDGAWIPAGKSFKIYGYAITSYTARCKIAASFMPKEGKTYNIRLVQTGQNSCKLEVVDKESNALEKSFSEIKCVQYQ